MRINTKQRMEIQFSIEHKKAIKGISKGLDWYRDHSSTATIKHLLDWQDRMSVWSVQLARICGKKKGTYLTAYFKRKLTYTNKVMTFVQDKTSHALAKEKACLQIEEEKKAEMLAEEIAYSMEKQIPQINKVLDACRQRISFMKR